MLYRLFGRGIIYVYLSSKVAYIFELLFLITMTIFNSLLHLKPKIKKNAKKNLEKILNKIT